MNIKSGRTGFIVGEHRHHDLCRFCLTDKLDVFFDCGYVPLAGGFLKKGSTEHDFSEERRYPLQLIYCRNCHLVQVNNAILGNTLFKDYFYFSSAIGTLTHHFRQYAKDLRVLFGQNSNVKLAELGCNDGVFLRPLKDEGFATVGIDPAVNVTQKLVEDGFEIVSDFFTEKSAISVREKHGRMDAILSSNSFAHIDDMHDVMRGVVNLLKPDGFLAFEVHYLPTLLRQMQYDMMYHEHMSYYSLTSISHFMDLFGMEVFDVKHIPIHAGSVRFYVQSKSTGIRKKTEALFDMQSEEKVMKIADGGTYSDFARKVQDTRTALLKLLNELKKQGKKIAGYGASGRATALSAFCKVDAQFLDYVIDDAPAKQGAFTPGNHLKIVDSKILATDERPDYVLLFAWSFADEIRKKNAAYLERGGRFIAPLPEVRILE